MAQSESMPDGSGGPDDDPVRHFVNHLRVRLSLSEIHFDLASLGHRTPNFMPLWRFVTTPDHLHLMHEDLGAAIDRYQSRFGSIHAARTAPPSITIDEDGGNG